MSRAVWFMAGWIVLAGAVPFQGGSPLEGTQWVVRVTPDPAAESYGEWAFGDQLVFQDGKVWMTESLKSGFQPTAYTMTPTADGWTLATEQASPQRGWLKWIVTVTGDDLAGTVTWTKRDGSAVTYLLEGEQFQRQGAVAGPTSGPSTGSGY